jgi:putative membrane protein
MVRIIAYAVATMIATLAVSTISESLLTFESAEAVLIFGLVAGVINAVIKPIVHFLTLPISCLTFGVFALVVNMALFKGGAAITPGVEVSWWGALAGSILASLASGLIFAVVDE